MGTESEVRRDVAWGKVLSVKDASGNEITNPNHIGLINPIRYRGYYYDNETELYYLQSRYYDATLGRFISPDDTVYLGATGDFTSYNLYAYCGNDPVNRVDPEGTWSWKTVFAATAIVAIVVAAVAVTVASCGMAAPAVAVAGGGILGGVSASAATTIATEALIVAGAATTATVVAAVVEEAEKNTARNNSVYVLVDSAGTVQYVGRTTNVEKRKAAHKLNPAREDLEMEVQASGLTLSEARALEQAGMVYYHTIKRGVKKNNQINGIAPKYWGPFIPIALGTLDYAWNKMTNEILYWAEN